MQDRTWSCQRSFPVGCLGFKAGRVLVICRRKIRWPCKARCPQKPAQTVQIGTWLNSSPLATLCQHGLSVISKSNKQARFSYLEAPMQFFLLMTRFLLGIITYYPKKELHRSLQVEILTHAQPRPNLLQIEADLSEHLHQDPP